MRIIFTIAILLLSVILVGCSGEIAAPASKSPINTIDNPQPSNIISGATQSQVNTALVEQSLENQQWISPGKVQISNFHTGATADYHVTIHNGVAKQGNSIELMPYQLRVTTDPNETQAEIPLKYRLYGDYKDIMINSDNNKENLSIVSVNQDGTAVTIKGFSPDDNRIITLAHLQYATFSVTYRNPDHTLEGYKKAPRDIVEDWVIIADVSPVFEPWETRNIPITLKMPDDISISETIFYEFTKDGSGRLNTIMKEQIPILEQILLTEDNEYQTTDDIDVKKRIEENVKSQAARDLISYLDREMPEASMLLFLNEQSSVSENLILNSYSIDLLVDFINKGYVLQGDLLSDKWEFWIGVTDITRDEMVTTEMCSRWLVSMR